MSPASAGAARTSATIWALLSPSGMVSRCCTVLPLARRSAAASALVPAGNCVFAGQQRLAFAGNQGGDLERQRSADHPVAGEQRGDAGKAGPRRNHDGAGPGQRARVR